MYYAKCIVVLLHRIPQQRYEAGISVIPMSNVNNLRLREVAKNFKIIQPVIGCVEVESISG
jgi:hypothetical protein